MPNMSPFAEVELRKNTQTPKKVRISKRVRDAIGLMVYQGMKREDAAVAVGLKPQSLYVALRKNETRAFFGECMADLRESAASRSIARVDKLADGARSEAVRLNANQWLAGLEGISPTQKHEHKHEHRLVPGYVLDPGAPDLRAPDHLRDVTPVIESEGREVPEGAENSQSAKTPDADKAG